MTSSATQRAVIFAVALLLAAPVKAQEEIDSAVATFKFIATSLQNYQRNSQIDPALHLGREAEQAYLALLRSSYNSFKQGFESDSQLCRFYHDPENGRMEIEERALLAMNYLPAVSLRRQRFLDVEKHFRESIQAAFGDELLEKLDVLRLAASSYEYLPVWALNEAEAIHFADTACGA